MSDNDDDDPGECTWCGSPYPTGCVCGTCPGCGATDPDGCMCWEYDLRRSGY